MEAIQEVDEGGRGGGGWRDNFRYGNLAKSAIIPQTFSIRSFGSKVTVEVEVNRVMHYVFNQTECMLKKC